MPILTLKVAAEKSPQLNSRLSAVLIETTQRILRKPPEVTAIAIDYTPTDSWIVAGRPLSEQGLRSYFLDIRITDETNTKAEKAQYIAEVHAAFADILGPLHEESYVHVHDVRAAAYGYGGRTQEFRYHHPAAV